MTKQEYLIYLTFSYYNKTIYRDHSIETFQKLKNTNLCNYCYGARMNNGYGDFGLSYHCKRCDGKGYLDWIENVRYDNRFNKGDFLLFCEKREKNINAFINKNSMYTKSEELYRRKQILKLMKKILRNLDE